MAVTGGLILAGLAACGGSPGPLPVTTVVSKVNTICTSYTVRIEALPAPSFAPASVTAVQLNSAAKYLDQAVPLLQREQASIKAVGEPQTDRSLYGSVLGALAAQLRDESAARTAAHGKQVHAFHDAVLSDQRDSTRLAGVAQQFGLDKCV